MKIRAVDSTSKRVTQFSTELQFTKSDFSTPAREHLFQDGTLMIEWGLLLRVYDWLELDEENGKENYPLSRPRFLTEDDADLLMQMASALDLKVTRKQLRLGEKGRPGSDGYGFTFDWLTPGGRRAFGIELSEPGFLLDPTNGRERLTTAQYELIQRISRESESSGKRTIDLQRRANLTSLSSWPGSRVILNGHLQKDRAIEVTSVKPTLVRNPETGNYRVQVKHPDIDADLLEQAVRESAGVNQIAVKTTSEGQRNRIIFSQEAEKSFQAVRDIPELTPSDVCHALSHPEDYFDGVLDLSEFSDRVSGIGPPIYRSLPIIKEMQGDKWFDWDVAARLDQVGSEEENPLPNDLQCSLKDETTLSAIENSIEEAQQRGSQYVPHPSGEGFIELTPQLKEAVVAARTLLKASVNGKLERPIRDVLHVHENLESLQFDKWTPPSIVVPQEYVRPPSLKSGFDLFNYQQKGYNWLKALFDQKNTEGDGWRGALLADDMGLGKTIQVLSFLSHLLEAHPNQPTLIVAPVALLTNWQKEAAKFFGASRFEPAMQADGPLLSKLIPEVAVARLQSQKLVCVSYETLRRHELLFGRVDWGVIVLDEAQKAKNPNTGIARSLRALKARFRLALTGTPVENSLSEMWALFDWAVPGLLGTLREFGERVIKPMRQPDESTAQECSEYVKTTIAPVFLRRMKTEVLKGKLPEIRWYPACFDPLQDVEATPERDFLPLSEEQEELYRSITEEMKNSRSKNAAIGYLSRMFGICAHPDLGIPAQTELRTMAEVSFPKGEHLFGLLEGIQERGEKVIVFANRKLLQRWISSESKRLFNLSSVPVINGDVTSSKKRLGIVEEWSATPGFGVLVLSPRAAGVGLNITAANHVIHYTREWNPAVENQATDRAYRIGQQRPVRVHTMSTYSPKYGDTVEVKLGALLTRKRHLMSQFVVPMGGYQVKHDELM